tara:strand:+ start:340 stop:507 length:168 start_codon:yes stop_codon:yes gene_type:complete
MIDRVETAILCGFIPRDVPVIQYFEAAGGCWEVRKAKSGRRSQRGILKSRQKKSH